MIFFLSIFDLSFLVRGTMVPIVRCISYDRIASQFVTPTGKFSTASSWCSFHGTARTGAMSS